MAFSDSGDRKASGTCCETKYTADGDSVTISGAVVSSAACLLKRCFEKAVVLRPREKGVSAVDGVSAIYGEDGLIKKSRKAAVGVAATPKTTFNIKLVNEVCVKIGSH